MAVLAEATFRDAFQAECSEEDVTLHCAKTFSAQLQSAEIQNAGMVTFVATQGAELIGYAQLVLKSTADCVTAERPSELLRIYVAASWHGRGVAKDLFDAALKAARDAGSDYLWLGVWERNPRAIAFYRKAGFEPLGEHEFVLGHDRQRDIVMGRPL